MTEEKNLLLKYLCMALPYGVIVDYKENEFETPHWRITTIYPATLNGWIGYDKRVGAGSESGSRPFEIGQYKPYLRPMSSMTMEDLQNLSNEIGLGVAFDDEKYELWLKGHTTILDNSLAINWLLENHFDFMGLIEKGLALEAPEGIYKHIV